jgi:hypothetical protein
LSYPFCSLVGQCMFDNDDEDLIRRLRAGAESSVERCMTAPSFPEAVIAQSPRGCAAASALRRGAGDPVHR